MIPAFLLTTKAKLIVGAAVLAGLWWWHQHEMAKVYSEAAQQTTEKLLKDQSKEIERLVAEKTAQLDAERAELDGQRTALATERAALSANRRAISETLKAGISEIAAKNVDVKHEIESVPDDAVNGRFRLALSRAREAERARVSDPAKP